MYLYEYTEYRKKKVFGGDAFFLKKKIPQDSGVAPKKKHL